MKKLLLIVMMFLNYTIVLYAWEVHVIPVYKDPTTGSWSGLFGYNAKPSWSDFKRIGIAQSTLYCDIAQLLCQQTHNAYILNPYYIEKLSSYVRLANGDILYCVPVDYLSTTKLHKTMETAHERDLTKQKFFWAPIEEVLKHRTIV